MKQGLFRIKESEIVVAPHAGAWIETQCQRGRNSYSGRSPPTRGRGLKRCGLLSQPAG